MKKQVLRKNFVGFLIAVGFYWGAAEKAHAQWVYIPDQDFAIAISTLVPSAIELNPYDGNYYMDTTNSAIVNMVSLDVSDNYITDLTGIQYFDSLKSLSCGDNELAFLPELPHTLSSLDCSANELSSLPYLPQSLNYLNCSYNQLDSLPNLPSNLIQILCINNNLTVLPTLPESLWDLECDNNKLTNLPALPAGISTIRCTSNLLTSLPLIPGSTYELSCTSNNLTSLPILPSSLGDLECGSNNLFLPAVLPSSLVNLECSYTLIRTLPNLPSTIRFLECWGDSLTSLPALPDSLWYLGCCNNLLTTLQTLPLSLQYLKVENNMISCLPILPERLLWLFGRNAGYTCLPNKPASITFLLGPDNLCTPYNSPCYIYPIISGSLWDDDNLNDQLDSGEIGHPNVIIQIQPGNYFFPTGDSTYYSYTLDTDTYTITANAIPYYNIVPSSYSTPMLSEFMIDSVNNFALQRMGIIHDLNVEITACEAAWRGFDMTHTLTATNNGTVRDTASVQYVFDSLLIYVNSSPPADVVNGDTLIWNNINLIPGQRANVSATFYLSNFTLDGTNLNSYAVVNPVIGDTTPANNYDALQQVVVGSYDPNNLTVDPPGAIEVASVTKGQWLDYVVRFQNTGNDTARNVEIRDSLSSTLTLSTIQIISSSSPMTWSIRHGTAYFDFNAINLPDSGANKAGSYGFVRFRLKADTTLVAGNYINNTAYIYFDANAGVVTNSTSNLIEEPLEVKSLTGGSVGVWIYPNPANTQLTIYASAFQNEVVMVTVIDLLGEIASPAFNLTPNPSPGGEGSALIDVSQLVAGMYFIRLKLESGIVVGRFVKE